MQVQDALLNCVVDLHHAANHSLPFLLCSFEFILNLNKDPLQLFKVGGPDSLWSLVLVIRVHLAAGRSITRWHFLLTGIIGLETYFHDLLSNFSSNIRVWVE